MIKRFYIVIILLSASITAWPQTNNIESVLTEIEANNLTLKTLREANNAQKYANKEDITLSNPEVEFNYIWGANSPTKGKEFAVSQEFDFQTILGYKTGVAKKQNELIDIEYKRERINLLLEAKKVTGLPIITEIMNANHLPLFEEVDIIQVARDLRETFEMMKTPLYNFKKMYNVYAENQNKGVSLKYCKAF